ncbi:MAG: hypothetical protein JXA36_01150 [Coriobacteriia bacterium]|nr:hypothetical protein [Coriobacteriia bacterium]
MKRSGRMLAALLLCAALIFGLVSSAWGEPPVSERVVVVLAPYITWSDVTGGEMPVTRVLAESSTVGNVNIRSSARFQRDPSQAHIVMTMSAGSPAAFDVEAPSAYSVDSILEGGTAGDVYRRSMGADPGGAEIVYLGLPRILRANTQSTLSTVPGVLGQAISDAGGTTAAIGNSDGGYRLGVQVRSRPAAVLAMDASGLVDFGDVSTSLLAAETDAPHGVVTDIEAMRAAYRESLQEMAESGGPGMVVLDPGDSERAFVSVQDASPEAAENHRVAAAAKVDSIVEMALEELPPGAVLMVLSTGQVRSGSGPSGFGPVILSGPGYEGGLVKSSSTHRTGLMTDLDVSATVLSSLGVERPLEVLGNAAAAEGASNDLDERTAYLTRINDTAVAVDTVRPVVQYSYIAVTVLILLACAVLLRAMQREYAGWGGYLAAVFSHGILLLLSMPVAATLMYLFVPYPGSAALVGALFVGTALLVWFVCEMVNRRWGSPAALALVCLLSAGVLLADQAVGAPLSFSGMFSYSPLLGARYYGLGNEGASIVVGAGLAGLAMLMEAFKDQRWSVGLRRFGPLVLGVLVVVLSAAPFFGANVGVLAWGTVAFGILWAQVNGRRVTWWSVLGMLAVIGLGVAAFSAYDLASGSGAQTHLARAWESAGIGGVGELWLIVARKAETNWRVLRATNWSILMIAILGFLGLMRWRPHGVFAETLKEYPFFAVAMTAALWGSLVGYFTEDSGIVIPALVMLYITGSLLHVMLARLRGSGAAVSG